MMLAILMAGLQVSAQDAAEKVERVAWFNEAKFGLFVHWGPFSVQGRDPNARFDYFAMKEDAPARVEFRKYAEEFNPKAFDAAKWMETAKAGGMRYLIFTSKRHDAVVVWSVAGREVYRDGADGAAIGGCDSRHLGRVVRRVRNVRVGISRRRWTIE